MTPSKITTLEKVNICELYYGLQMTPTGIAKMVGLSVNTVSFYLDEILTFHKINELQDNIEVRESIINQREI